MSHALLLSGLGGIGKNTFAEAFAGFLLCLSPVKGRSCGSCKTCLLKNAGSHPDFLRIEPEEKSKSIKIDQIRHLTEFVAKTPQQGESKVAIIRPAESLNLNAANALLKCLEEPAGNTFLILITKNPNLLMATIRSRCQVQKFNIPERSESLAWLSPIVVGQDPDYLLDCANGAPLSARDLLESDALEARQEFAISLIDIGEGKAFPLDVAQKIDGSDPLMLIELLTQWIQQSIKHHMHEQAIHHKGERMLIETIATIEPSLLFRLLDKLMLVKKQLMSGANPNKQLVIEEMLLDWQALNKQQQKSVQARHSLINALN